MTLKPLDLVQTPKGRWAMVTEVNNDGSASIDFLKGQPRTGERNAWWRAGDGLILMDSIPSLLANACAHPFGSNTKQGDRDFPLERS